MTAAGKPRPPARWPLALLSVLLLVLVGAVIAAAQLYWTSLRGGVAQMRASMSAAQVQQRQLVERLRAAEAALAQRTGAEASPDAAVGGTAAKPVAPQPVVPEPVPALRRSLPPGERGHLMARVRELGLAASRLPPGRAPGGPRAAAARQLLREQLAIAAAAAGAGDVQLLDAALFAAERLTGAPHRVADPRGAELARQLAEVRARLRVPPTAAGVAGGGRAAPPR